MWHTNRKFRFHKLKKAVQFFDFKMRRRKLQTTPQKRRWQLSFKLGYRIQQKSVKLAYPQKDAYLPFSGLFQFKPFFGHFLLLLEIETKLIKFRTKRRVKQAKFLQSKLVCCCGAKQQSKIYCIFEKVLRHSARSKG